MNKEKILDVIQILGFIGVLLCIYLYYTDVMNISVICPNNGCAQVASSQYSRLFGIHVSLWGLLYYVSISTVLLFRKNNFISSKLKLLLGTIISAGVIFTLYLRFVELFYIKAICIWCWGSVVVISLILIFYILFLRKSREDVNVT